jgi:hypothetical protein
VAERPGFQNADRSAFAVLYISKALGIHPHLFSWFICKGIRCISNFKFILILIRFDSPLFQHPSPSSSTCSDSKIWLFLPIIDAWRCNGQFLFLWFLFHFWISNFFHCLYRIRSLLNILLCLLGMNRNDKILNSAIGSLLHAYK